MKKMVNGVLCDLSEEDIIDIQERELAEPFMAWSTAMTDSDSVLPRWAEDLFDLVTGTKQLAELPELAAKIADKKTLRGSKP